MDFGAGQTTFTQPRADGSSEQKSAAWSIARLIELLDDAIDSAGAQLSRSEGLRFDWTDDLAVLPARRRRSRRSALPCTWIDDVEHEMHRDIEPP